MLVAVATNHIVTILVLCITAGYLRADAIEVTCEINGKFTYF